MPPRHAVGFTAKKGKEMGELLVMDQRHRGSNRRHHHVRRSQPRRRARRLLPTLLALQRTRTLSVTRFCRLAHPPRVWWRTSRRVLLEAARRKLHEHHATGRGIVSTVKATRTTNFIQLRAKAEDFLKRMSLMGVTTVEGKSWLWTEPGDRTAATQSAAQFGQR